MIRNHLFTLNRARGANRTGQRNLQEFINIIRDGDFNSSPRIRCGHWILVYDLLSSFKHEVPV